MMQDALVAVVPCLQGQKLLQQQSCYLPSTADHLPVIGAMTALYSMRAYPRISMDVLHLYCACACAVSCGFMQPPSLTHTVQDRCRICLERS